MVEAVLLIADGHSLQPVCFYSTADSGAALSDESAWPGPFGCWLTGRHALLQCCSCMLVLQRKCVMIPQSAAPKVDPKKTVLIGVATDSG